MRIEQLFMEAKSFADLEVILNNAKPEISFFGARYLSFTNYVGTVRLHFLFDRMLEIRNSDIDFSEDQRQIGRRLYKKIIDLEDKSYNLVNQANIITRFFNALRQIIFCGDSDLSLLAWSNSVFNMYTYYQFFRAFGKSPEEAIKIYDSEPGDISEVRDFNTQKNFWLIRTSYKGPIRLKRPEIIAGPPQESYYGTR